MASRDSVYPVGDRVAQHSSSHHGSQKAERGERGETETLENVSLKNRTSGTCFLRFPEPLRTAEDRAFNCEAGVVGHLTLK